MNSVPDFQLPRRATDPHEFPATSDDWHSYRRWLARHGRQLRERMESAPTLPEREAARREWEAIGDLTRNAGLAYQEFQTAEEDAEYADYVRRLANRIWSDWVSADSERPSRDPSRHAVTTLAHDGEPGSGTDEGPAAGRPVGLDEEGRSLSAAMHKLDTPAGDGLVMRLPRANVIALTAVLEEFAARLMLARAKGKLLEGEAYIRAVVELQADLESRRFVD